MNVWKSHLKLSKWWDNKVPVMMILIYGRLVSSHNPPGVLPVLGTLGLFLVATLGIGTLGHLVNDYFDLEKDERTGARNLFAGCGVSGILARFTVAIFFSTWPWLLLDTPKIVWFLLVAEFVLFLSYSAPPLRLKERGLAGPCADALYAYTIPLLVTWFLFGRKLGLDPSYGFALAILPWTCFMGLRGILTHQLLDCSRDLQSGTVTLATETGSENIVFILNRCLTLEIVSGLVFLLALGLLAPSVLAGFTIYLLVWLVRIRRYSIARDICRFSPLERVHFVGFRLMTRFVLQWLPILILGEAVGRNSNYLWLALFHFYMFDNGIKSQIYRLAVWAGRQIRN